MHDHPVVEYTRRVDHAPDRGQAQGIGRQLTGDLAGIGDVEGYDPDGYAQFFQCANPLDLLGDGAVRLIIPASASGEWPSADEDNPPRTAAGQPVSHLEAEFAQPAGDEVGAVGLAVHRTTNR